MYKLDLKISWRTIFVRWYWNTRNIFQSISSGIRTFIFHILHSMTLRLYFGSFISFWTTCKSVPYHFRIIFYTHTNPKVTWIHLIYKSKTTCLRYSPQKPPIISAFLFKIYVLFLIVCDSQRIFSFLKSEDITIKYTLQVHIHISDHII